MSSREEVRARLLAERDEAIELLLDAQVRLNVVEPESIREPILWGLRATVELCRSHRSILGLPVQHQLALAYAITTTRGDDDDE